MFKQYKSQPTDAAFFQKHAAAIKGFMAAVTLAQIISALTEAGIIYKIIEDSLVMFPVFAAVAGLLAAVAGVAMIELFGIRYALPYGLRGIIEKVRGTAEQRESADWTITILFLIISTGLLILSLNLSNRGSQMTIENIGDRQQEKETIAHKLEAKNERSAAITDFKTDSAAVAEIWSKRIETKGAAYDSQIAGINTKLEQRKGKQERTGKSYRSSIERHERQLNEKQTEKNAAIAGLTDSLTTALAIERKRLRKNLQQISSDRDTKISSTVAKVENNSGNWRSTAKWLIPICILLQLIGIIIQQWFRFRAGIETRLIVSEYYFRPSAWAEWKESRSERIQQKVRAEISRFENKTLAPPEIRTPHILTDFADFVQPSMKLAIEDRTGNEIQKLEVFSKTANSNTSSDLEDRIKSLTQAQINAESENHHEAAKLLELEAIEVIRLYLSRDMRSTNIQEIKTLHRKVIEHINEPNSKPNPFDTNRFKIGFKQQRNTGDYSASINNGSINNVYGKMTASKRPVVVPSRSCRHCSKDISHKRSDAKFCNDVCRKAYWKDKNGGKEFDANLYHKTK